MAGQPEPGGGVCGSGPTNTPRVSAAKMPAKSKASGLLPCEVEITPPSTVDLVGIARFVVVTVVVDVSDVPELDVDPVLVDTPPVFELSDVPVTAPDEIVDVTDAAAGGEAKLGLMAPPGKMKSSMVGSMAVL